MSQIKNNVLLQGISGTLGKLVVFRVIRGRLVICNRPRKTGILTEHQKKMKDRFLRAVQYARAQMANPETKAEYAEGTNSNKHSAYLVALTDHLNAPVIKVVDASRYNGLAGDAILIRAQDDFKVVSVKVIIQDGDGVVVEEGDAVFKIDSLDEWSYTASVTNTNVEGFKLEVMVRDKPGNLTTAERELTLKNT